MGRNVCVKVWIHFITGDTSGHNNLVGHMNASNMKYPYLDCKCQLHDSDPRPKCKLVTLEEIRDAHKTPNGAASLLKKAIKNAFDNVWFGDLNGDTLGHNNLVKHTNASNMKYLYLDCKCQLHELSDPRPKCKLVTLEEIRDARKKPNGVASLLMQAIKNAFDNVWFGNLKYGIKGSVPAEMLHVSSTGKLKYIFEVLDSLIEGTKDKESFHDLHRCLVKDAKRQSERDFPRMSARNGITYGTKMCGSEHVGNCFILLCFFHTRLGQKLISTHRTESLKSYKECLKLYLSFKRWVNGRYKRVKNSSVT